MYKRSKDYHESLINDLKNPAEAVAYLEVALEEGSSEEFLSALRNVAEARGISESSSDTTASYNMLFNKGNQQLHSFMSLLKCMGLRLSVQEMAY